MSGVRLRGLGPGDGDWVVRRHAALYAREQGFDGGFGPMIAGVVSRLIADDGQNGVRGWIAADGARRLGCIFCDRGEAPGVARLRLFLVEPDARGQGIGRALLAACIGHAGAAGFARLRLSTTDAQARAGRVYRAAGFRPVASARATRFGVTATEETLEIAL